MFTGYISGVAYLYRPLCNNLSYGYNQSLTKYNSLLTITHAPNDQSLEATGKLAYGDFVITIILYNVPSVALGSSYIETLYVVRFLHNLSNLKEKRVLKVLYFDRKVEVTRLKKVDRNVSLAFLFFFQNTAFKTRFSLRIERL